MITYSKAPDEEVIRGFDWSDRLTSGDKITASEWTVTGLTGSGATFDDTASEIELAGGTATNQYLVTNKVTTSDGEVFQRSFYMLVRDR